MIHPERLENHLFEVLLQGLAGEDLHQVGDHVHIVVVIPLRSGLEAQREELIELDGRADRRAGSIRPDAG